MTGDRLEAAAIGAVLILNTAIGFVTELRARRAMDALLQLDAPRALVLRDGRRHDIDARHLVPGDVFELEPGQQTPADARLLQATGLTVDEAPLTGRIDAGDQSAGPRSCPLRRRSPIDSTWFTRARPC